MESDCTGCVLIAASLFYLATGLIANIFVGITPFFIRNMYVLSGILAFMGVLCLWVL